MKIGIISDTHGNASAWVYILNNIFDDADIIIHAGDILYGADRHCITRFTQALKNSKVPIIAAMGNCDRLTPTSHLPIEIHNDYGTYNDENKHLVFTHGDRYHSMSSLKMLAKKVKANIVISGHSHIYNVTEEDGIYLINPGSPNNPKHESGVPTVMTLENDRLYLIDARNGNMLHDYKLEITTDGI